MPISSVWAFLSAGVVLGLSAGFSPGPLLTLVIAQTLRHGTREGVKVALAPLLTDLPIILLSFLVLKTFAESEVLLGAISLAGGAFVIHLAIDNFRAVPAETAPPGQTPRSLGRGILVNFLSPHPYLFWMTVGAPLMVKASALNPLAALLFLTGFYSCLVGAKVFLAIISGRWRSHTSGRVHRRLLRFLSVLLLLFAGLLIKEGLQLLGWASP